MFIQLYEYFNTNNLLFKSQYGFRPKHSAEMAALEIVDKIIYQMDNSETPKLRCSGGREFNPRPGQYSRMSFSFWPGDW